MGARIVSFVVPSDGLDCERIESCCFGLVFTKSGPGCSQVKNLHNLGADTAGKMPVSSNGILSRNSSLFVRCRPERQILVLLQYPMPCFDAIPSRIDIGDVGSHRRVYPDGTFLSRRDSGLHRELRGWLYTRGDENQVRRLFESIRSRNTQTVRRLNRLSLQRSFSLRPCAAATHRRLRLPARDQRWQVPILSYRPK